MKTERRKFSRFLAQDTAFAVLRPAFSKVGKIKDISGGGLAFHYIGYDGQQKDSSEMDIFLCEEGGFHLSKIPCKIIHDYKVDDYQTSIHRIETRWCGVEFRGLTEEQAAELEFFLKNHTTGTA